MTHAFHEKEKNLVDKVALQCTASFFALGNFENEVAGPAFTTQKSKQKEIEIMMVMHRVSLYICVGVVGFPAAPLLCDLAGLAVVRAVFWCSGAVEPWPGTS